MLPGLTPRRCIAPFTRQSNTLIILQIAYLIILCEFEGSLESKIVVRVTDAIRIIFADSQDRTRQLQADAPRPRAKSFSPPSRESTSMTSRRSRTARPSTSRLSRNQLQMLMLRSSCSGIESLPVLLKAIAPPKLLVAIALFVLKSRPCHSA